MRSREERNEKKTREGIPRGLAGISRLRRRGENAALATIGGTGETEVPNEVAVISQRGSSVAGSEVHGFKYARELKLSPSKRHVNSKSSRIR